MQPKPHCKFRNGRWECIVSKTVKFPKLWYLEGETPYSLTRYFGIGSDKCIKVAIFKCSFNTVGHFYYHG